MGLKRRLSSKTLSMLELNAKISKFQKSTGANDGPWK